MPLADLSLSLSSSSYVIRVSSDPSTIRFYSLQFAEFGKSHVPRSLLSCRNSQSLLGRSSKPNVSIFFFFFFNKLFRRSKSMLDKSIAAVGCVFSFLLLLHSVSLLSISLSFFNSNDVTTDKDNTAFIY
jgi:hypothetical protein